MELVPGLGYGRRLCLREAGFYADSSERGQTNDNRCRECSGCIGEELVRMRARSSQYTSRSANKAVYSTSKTFVPIIWLADEYQPHPATQVASSRAHSSRRWSKVNRGQVEVVGTSTLHAKACGDGDSSVIYPLSRPILHTERGMPRATAGCQDQLPPLPEQVVAKDVLPRTQESLLE